MVQFSAKAYRNTVYLTMTSKLFQSLLLAATAAMALGSDDGSCAADFGDAASSSSKLLLYVSMFFAFPTVFWLVAYLIPQITMAFRSVPDLKKRYDAEWALVTGGGSGKPDI